MTLVPRKTVLAWTDIPPNNIGTNAISTSWALLNLFIVISVMQYVYYVKYASCGIGQYSIGTMAITDGLTPTWWHYQMETYIFVNFDALAQASDFRIEGRRVVFVWLIQDWNPWSPTPNRQQTECLLTNRLSYRGSSQKNLKSTARPYAVMISEHSTTLTPLPVGFRTWLWRYICLLLLISMWMGLVVKLWVHPFDFYVITFRTRQRGLHFAVDEIHFQVHFLYEIVVYWFTFNWIFFSRVQPTIRPHQIRYWRVVKRVTCNYPNQ